VSCDEYQHPTSQTGFFPKKRWQNIEGFAIFVPANMSAVEITAGMKDQIKGLIIENLMLQVTAAEIADDLLLFGPGGLGLDSVDALQLVLALDKQFGLKITDPETARQILRNVNTITEAVNQKLAA
jgi:acyl carrier protein